MRVRVRVRPGARRVAVGGRWDGPDGAEPALLVAVSAPAVDGRANAAVCAALARELGVRERRVRIVTGLRSRDKVVEIDEDDPALARRITALRDR